MIFATTYSIFRITWKTLTANTIRDMLTRLCRVSNFIKNKMEVAFAFDLLSHQTNYPMNKQANFLKTFPVYLSVFLLASACSKNSDDNGGVTSPVSVLEFKLDGTSRSYDNCTALFAEAGGQNVLTIKAGPFDDSIDLSIVLTNNKPIESGFSVNQSISGEANGTIAYKNYRKKYASLSADQNDKSQFDVKITSKTTTLIKGIFTAKLFTAPDSTGDVKFTVTEGQFNAKIIKSID